MCRIAEPEYAAVNETVLAFLLFLGRSVRLGGVTLAGGRDRFRRPVLLLAFAYFVLIGGTPLGDASPRLLLVNILLGAALVWAYLRSVRTDADLVDRLALLGYLLFLGTILLSAFPRQSFDVALSTLGLLAAFHLARRELRDPTSRRWLMAVLAEIALLVGAIALANWGGWWAVWFSEFGTAPPQAFPFTGLIFGHRHDVAILLVLCVPAAIGWRGRRGMAVAVTTMAVALGAVFLEGSRNVWLAAALATLVVAIPPVVTRLRRAPPSRRVVMTGVAAFLGLVVVAFVSGLWERMTGLSTFAGRLHLWDASVHVWLLDPFSGLGPGSFPWLLQLTDYFKDETFTPRHPDGAIPQLLAEAGLLGLAAAACVGAALVAGIRRASQLDWRAVWSLAFFGFACLFANPTDFGFLLAVALTWASIATPPASNTPLERLGRAWPRVHRPSLAAGVVILIAALTFAAAGLAHERAAGLAHRGRTAEAESLLLLAVTLDPAMGLYERELGVTLLGSGQLDAAAAHLRRATTINGSDAVALRALAEAELARGEPAAAAAAAEAAVALARSNVANLVTLARTAAASGHDDLALNLIAEAVAASPELTALDMGAIGLPFTSQEALEAALAYWMDDRPIPGPVVLQPAWLTGLAGRDDLLPTAQMLAEAEIAELVHLAMSCRFDAALALSDAALQRQANRPEYWDARYLVESAADGPVDLTITLGGELSSAIGLAEGSFTLPNNLVAISTDRWGYGRTPMVPPAIENVMPSMTTLFSAWMRDARATAAATLPGTALGTCARR